MGPIGSKVIEVKGHIYVFFFSVCHVMSYLRLCVCVCVICLHRRNHLTATSRRVKLTSVQKNCKLPFVHKIVKGGYIEVNYVLSFSNNT